MKIITKNRYLFTCLLVYSLFYFFPNHILAQNQPTVDQFMGVNWQWSNPIEPTECVGFIREFHDWSNDQNDWEYNYPLDPVTQQLSIYPNQCFGYNPPNSGAIDYDYFYNEMLGLGHTISPAMTNSLLYYRGFKETTIDTIVSPLNPNDTTFLYDTLGVGHPTRIPVVWTWNEQSLEWDNPPLTSSASYRDRADWLYHFLARYGSQGSGNNPCDLKYCGDADNNLGQEQITYIESWNEPDKEYIISDLNQTKFTPEIYAAMANIDYDGDDGINAMLDPNVTPNAKITATSPGCGGTYELGVINADPNVRFVMGGTVDIVNIWDDWILPMRTWFMTNRDDGEDFPFDVLNFHHYSVSGANLFTDQWISPERDTFRRSMEAIVALRDTSFGGAWADKEIWLSEFGYDTNESDPLGWDFADFNENNPEVGDPIGTGYTPEILQAQWTLRSYLELAASGIDRAIVHDLRDGSSMAGAAWDKHTGLLNADNEPKKAWFYVYTMKNLLEGYNYFDDSQSNSTFTADDAICGSGAARVYQFKNDAGQSVWAVWSPTDCGDEIPVTITLSSNHNGATAFRISEPSIRGVIEDLTVNGNSVTITATETPVFIIEENRTAPTCPQNITASNQTCSSIDLEFDIPMGETYDTYQLWFGPTSSISNPNNPDFAALSGNGMRFQQDIPGTQNCLSMTGLSSGTAYYVYIIPENENGIPTDGQGNVQYCFTTVTTSTTESVCSIDMSIAGGLVNISSNTATPGFTEGLFDEQNLDFCQATTPIPVLPPWVNFGGQAVMEIEFLQDFYIIDQFYFFDASSSGVFLIEGSVDGTNWTELTEFYTNTLDGWRTESNFEQPSSGIKFLRLTAQSDRARLKELFICGRPVCPITTIQDNENCTDVDITLNNGTDCAVASEFTILNSTGEVTVPVNGSSFNFPYSFFNQGWENQLIPGVNYKGELTTCAGTACTTDEIVFQAGQDCGVVSVLDFPALEHNSYYSGCRSAKLEVPSSAAIPHGATVQIWKSTATTPFDPTVHPLVSDPNAESYLTTVKTHSLFGKYVALNYECNEQISNVAYRYLTETASSPLFTFETADNGISNLPGPWCACAVSIDNPSFIYIDDCKPKGVLHEGLDVGEKLFHKEIKRPKAGPDQILSNASHSITSPSYYYSLQNTVQATNLKFKQSNDLDWTETNLKHIYCDIPINGTTNESEGQLETFNSTKLKVYPNPSRQDLYVECPASHQLQLLSIDGRRQKMVNLRNISRGYHFDTNHLTPGIYFLRAIQADGTVESVRFVVQR